MDNRLKSYVERIAKLAEERKAIGGDIADILQEAKSNGYIPKTLRKVVTRYMANPAALAEDDALLITYEAALGRVGRALDAIRGGATVDDASKATGVPRATVARASAVSNRRKVIISPLPNSMGTVGEGGPAPVPDIDESCGPVCPVSATDGVEEGNGLPSAKGKAEYESPAARRHTSDDALAPALGISRCEDDASPAGPHDTILSDHDVAAILEAGARPVDDLAIPPFLRGSSVRRVRGEQA